MTARWYVVPLVGALVGCVPPEKQPPPPPPEKLHTTYRIISGVSMGGIGTAALGLTAPDRFDGVGALGGPLDAAFFQYMLDNFLTAGLCTRQDLEAQLALDPVKLNDPKVMDACAKKAVPGRWEHNTDLNHWHPTNSGGAFDRDTYIRMMSDLTLAFGNFFTDNPMSAFAPPGVTGEAMRHPADDFCTNPIRVHGLYNLEYNPQGTYDAITFCDGEPQLYRCRTTKERVDFCADPANVARPLPWPEVGPYATQFCVAKGGAEVVDKNSDTLAWLDNAGRTEPCREPSRPVGMMLAFDLNGNGRRDYGEPVVNNSHERYDDSGADGCADAYESGTGSCNLVADSSAVDPNQDNYDPETRPFGTERNWRWDDGEPFRDDGLDGVAATHDSGEGNGTFDMVAGRKKMFAYDGRTNYRKLDAAGKKRLKVLGDGGIRDVFNLGLMARHLLSTVKAERATPVGLYRDFTEVPLSVDSRGNFQPWHQGWSRLPADMLMLYGKENPTDQDRKDGEGDHVGTPAEAVNRFSLAFNWAGSTWPKLERPATPPTSTSTEPRQRLESFSSAALGAKWEYAIALPPGYFEPENKDKRYPVMYMLHGYGMSPDAFSSTALVTDLYATDPQVNFRPMIMVFPNGRCCWVKGAERDCRSTDDQGRDFGALGYERECHSGTFWINRAGYTADDATRYGDAFFELMDHVDRTYRTQPAAEVEAR